MKRGGEHLSFFLKELKIHKTPQRHRQTHNPIRQTSAQEKHKKNRFLDHIRQRVVAKLVSKKKKKKAKRNRKLALTRQSSGQILCRQNAERENN